MGYHRVISGISESYQWVISGLSVGYQWVISGLSVGYQRRTDGRRTEVFQEVLADLKRVVKRSHGEPGVT